MSDLVDRIETLYEFGLLTYTYPEYRGVFELMVTGYAIKHNMDRKFLTDTLHYMYKSNGSKPVYDNKGAITCSKSENEN